MANRPIKIAIVCDWLAGTGGAERVVLELHRLFPEAPIYTSQYDRRPEKWFGDDWFKNVNVRTLWLGKLPNSWRKWLGPLRAWAFSRLKLKDLDLIISVSGAEAKFVKARNGVRHICYCHAPTHYYWGRYEQYIKQPGFGWLNPLARLGLRLFVKPMRWLDYRAAQRPDEMIANSLHSAAEINKYYGRQAEVIHPPVDIERFASAGRPAQQRKTYVAAGRQTPYKRTDLAVEAANLTGLPLLVIGRGPDNQRLRRLAKDNVSFHDQATDAEMTKYLGSAKGFIFPGVDDFGIVAVEALAAGTPVLAYGDGGALEYVDETSGMIFNEPSPQSLAKVWRRFDARNYDPQKVATRARDFAPEVFQKKIMQLIDKGVK